jgi:hypothetical protein
MKGARFCTSSILVVMVFSGLVCLSSLASGGWLPQDQGANFNLEGKITDVTAGKLTVNMQGNIIMHVSYDAETQIHRKDGSAGSPKDLKTGAMVKVEGNLNSSGVVEARQIDLE